jgi:hypothetical protein
MGQPGLDGSPSPQSGVPARELLWPLLAAMAAAAAAAPLWSSRFLPYQDAPEHIAAIRIIADYRTTGFDFARWFVIDLHRLQYLGFYLPGAALAKLVGPEAACRLLLTAIAFALPAASWMLLESFQGDRRLAVLAPAVFHTAPLYLGFFNFVASVPATIAVVALAERELRAPRAGRAAVLALGAAALLWLHPSALALALGAAVLLAVTSGQSPGRIARALAPFVPSLALICAWAVRAVAARDGAGASARTPPIWLGPKGQILDLLRLGNVVASHVDEVFILLIGLIFVAVILVPGRPRIERGWRLPLVAAGTFATYMILPWEAGFIGYINLRALPFLALVVLASPSIAKGRATSALLAAAVALQIAYAVALSRIYRAFDREAQGIELSQVLQAASPGTSLVALIYEQKSHLVMGRPYLHFGSYFEVERGGRARTNFAEAPWSPVRYRPETAPPTLPLGWALEPDLGVASRVAAVDDYLLVRGPGDAPGPPFFLRAEAGRWALYERR